MKQTIALKGKSGEKGQALVELAIVLPLLLLLLFGAVDFSRAIHAKSIITQMSREAANLVARPNTSQTGVDATDFQNAMYFVAKDAGQLKMMDQGMMYITKVEYVSGSTGTAMAVKIQVPWIQGNSGKFSSKLPAVEGATVSANDIGNITLTAATPIAYVVEVFYEYNSLLLGSAFSPKLSSVSIF
jgi:Flp pilus assembly protein TadG